MARRRRHHRRRVLLLGGTDSRRLSLPLAKACFLRRFRLGARPFSYSFGFSQDLRPAFGLAENTALLLRMARNGARLAGKTPGKPVAGSKTNDRNILPYGNCSQSHP